MKIPFIKKSLFKFIKLSNSFISTHHTHDVGKDCSGRADQSSHDSEEIVVEEEALRTERPPGIAVQHSDDHRHVSATNGRSQSVALQTSLSQTIFREHSI